MDIYAMYGRLSEHLALANEKAAAATQMLILLKNGERMLDDLEVTPQGIRLKGMPQNGHRDTSIPASETIEDPTLVERSFPYQYGLS